MIGMRGNVLKRYRYSKDGKGDLHYRRVSIAIRAPEQEPVRVSARRMSIDDDHKDDRRDVDKHQV